MSQPPAPQNPDFEAAVRDSFARQPMMATLGAELTLVAPGEAHIRMANRAALTQQNGFLHAGAITSIADSACGYAAFSLAPPNTDVLAVEFKINLMAPARGETVIARAKVLRAGRTLTVCLAEVAGVLPSGVEQTVATMLSTLIIRPISGDHSR